jgi:hypothetical protein
VKRTVSMLVALTAALCVVSVLAGCAGRRPAVEEPDAGLVLEYDMPEGRLLTYELSNSFTQAMEVRGQSFETVSTASLVFSTEAKGKKGNDLAIGVTVKSMHVSMASPQGELVPDTSTVTGKSFDMTVSAIGEESDLEGAASVRYDLGPAGDRGLTAEFSNIFPDLPGRPIAIGDSWTTTTDATEDTGQASIHISIENINTLTGFETIDGRECARIAVEFTGTLEGEGSEQNVKWTTTGDLSGTGTTYFAHEEGILVRETSSGVGEGVIVGSGEREMTVPMTRTFSFETRLVE